MKKFVLMLKMIFFKLQYFVAVILYRTKICYIDKSTRKTIKKHKEPLMIANNHVGFHDGMLLWSVFIFKFVRFVATDEVIKNRISKFFFNWNGIITIKRGNISLGAYTEIRRSLKQGFWVGISPEGHINRKPDLDDFHYGTAQIAISSRVNIIPVYVVPQRKVFLKKQIVYIGNPIVPAGDKKEVTAHLKEKITGLLMFHRKKVINSYFKNKSFLYVLPAIDNIRDDQLSTTFYKKYSQNTDEYTLSKCAWYYLEKILLKLNIPLTEDYITFSESGKPIHKDICFNISHSKQVVAIIISKHDCSVDIRSKNASLSRALCDNIKRDNPRSSAVESGVTENKQEGVADWVKHECEKKLLESNDCYWSKQLCHNNDEYLVGVKARGKIILKRKIVAKDS